MNEQEVIGYSVYVGIDWADKQHEDINYLSISHNLYSLFFCVFGRGDLIIIKTAIHCKKESIY